MCVCVHMCNMCVYIHVCACLLHYVLYAFDQLLYKNVSKVGVSTI